MSPERQYGDVFAVNVAMSSDLTVQSVAPPRPSSDVVGDQRAAATAIAYQVAVTAPSSPLPNPSLRLDAALGLVVIEFRNDDGAITTSIPSERQLRAYQRWQTSQPGATHSEDAQFHAPERPSRAGVAASGDPTVLA